MKKNSVFKFEAPFAPAGDQIQAIEKLANAYKDGVKEQVLLGVTGSGKTFTVAKVVAELDCSTLVIAPNKTLAAQLYLELRSFFPQNAVGFFISYYDYYQPEAYIPSTDTYIAKDSCINDDIDKMRHQATRCLFEEKSSIIVASVSCIYGLGSPSAYSQHVVHVKRGQVLLKENFLRSLLDIQYSRQDSSLDRGHFRVRGHVVDVLPSHQAEEAVRVEFFGDEVEEILIIEAMTGRTLRSVDDVSLYPNSHYVSDRNDRKAMIREVLTDLGVRLRELKALDKWVEAQRLEQRTMQDIEMLEELGFCPGIENYSRYLSGKLPGEPPPCLLDYFPKDGRRFLTVIDESHITIPQLGAMFKGDRARKQNLVNFGFRLPSALDNRPLNFHEFLERTEQILYVSATPGPFELKSAKDHVVEQIIRPTGLLDPQIVIRPATAQIDDLLGEIKLTIASEGRVLITTLTKKMAEELSSYYRDLGIRIRYLHSDIESLERSHLLRGLRKGDFDVLVGINLLREGLDLPEVRLVAVLDADKEGFLRSHTSLIQIVGRAARNKDSRVIFYADSITKSMHSAMQETERRREKQAAYNEEHGLVPISVSKSLPDDMRVIYGLSEALPSTGSLDALGRWIEENRTKSNELEKGVRTRQKQLKACVTRLDFEKAAELKEEILRLKTALMTL
ncbi:MAG: excinuclease ABC subunit UvrB [Oligoflexales bacterium]|nr:excinuclease ABC subunit UvrB [Oligoflexales bacterium]